MKKSNRYRDEKPLGDGIIKVWRDDAKEISIHHRAGLTIALNDLEEIELFQWLANDLNKRGLLPALRKWLDEHELLL